MITVSMPVPYVRVSLNSGVMTGNRAEIHALENVDIIQLIPHCTKRLRPVVNY